jgi:hypothetical protein
MIKKLLNVALRAHLSGVERGRRKEGKKGGYQVACQTLLPLLLCVPLLLIFVDPTNENIP